MWAPGLMLGAAGLLTLATAARAAERLFLPEVGDVEVERFELLASDVRFQVDGRPSAAPGLLRGIELWRGRIAGEPRSRVVLMRDAAGAITGAAEWGSRRYEFGAAGAVAVSTPGSLDLGSCAMRRAISPAFLAPAVEKAATVRVPVGLYRARVLVESDHEFFLKHGPSVEAVTAKIVGALAEVSAILEEEVGVRLEIASLAIWQTADDPWWNPDDGGGTLGWSRYAAKHPVRSFPRAFVHLMTGVGDSGGFLAGLCSGYGSAPSDISWNGGHPLVAAHEIGHVLGSDHTHCYEPPVDRCSSEPGCYEGVAVPEPEFESSVMSYCETWARSYHGAGQYRERGERVTKAIRTTVDLADARYPTCLGALTDALDLRVESVARAAATLAWNDIFPNETGWTLERLSGKKWKPQKKLAAGVARAELAGLRPGSTTFYRLIARFKGNVSEPSLPVTVQVP